jgi:hypothetical protein
MRKMIAALLLVIACEVPQITKAIGEGDASNLSGYPGRTLDVGLVLYWSFLGLCDFCRPYNVTPTRLDKESLRRVICGERESEGILSRCLELVSEKEKEVMRRSFDYRRDNFVCCAYVGCVPAGPTPKEWCRLKDCLQLRYNRILKGPSLVGAIAQALEEEREYQDALDAVLVLCESQKNESKE